MKSKKDNENRWENFFMIPNKVVDSGLLARMQRKHMATYLVIGRHQHPNSGLSYPSIVKICERGGICKDSACTATKDLAAFGLIEKIRTGKGFKFQMAYRIFRTPEINWNAVYNVIPKDTEKRRPKKDEKTGKFLKVPCDTELDVVPIPTDSDVVPSGTESFNSVKEVLNNYSKKNPPIVSQETIEELKKEMGEKKLRAYMRKHGYPLTLINSNRKEEQC